MNTKHTPGPWHTDVPDPAFVNYEVRTDQTIICTMGMDMPLEEEAANARLIAAAPELLEALRMFVVWYGLRDKHDTLLPPKMQEAELAQAMRAIAKATNGLD